MKFLTIVFCGLIAAGIANPAAADPFGRETWFSPLAQDQRSRPSPQRGTFQPMPQRDMGPAMPQRDMQGNDPNDRGRMSPDELRQLRRDIQDAGKDIYRAPRPARGDPRRSGRR